MKANKFWSIMLCMAMLTTAGAVMTSCGNDNEPSGYSNSNNNNGGYDDGYNGGYDDGYNGGGSGNGGNNGGSDNGGNNGGGSGNGGNNGGNNGGGSGNGGGNQDKDVAPNAPTGVKASVQGPKKYPYVLVEWDYVSSGVDHYDIYRSTSKTGSFSKKATREGYCYNWADESLEYNKTYYYKIKAVSKGGKASEFSEVVGVWVEPYNE